MTELLKILPVKQLKEQESQSKKHKLNPILPGASESGALKAFLMVIQAPVRSGKTNFIVNLLYNSQFNYKKLYEEVIYISPTIENDETGTVIMKDDDIIKITDRLDQLDLILESIVEIQKQKLKDERTHTLIIMDDCLGLIKTLGGSYFATLCSKFRHWKLSLWVTTQNFRSLPPTCRYNSSSYIIFRTNNSKEQTKMQEEFEGNYPFHELYERATKERYSFLYLNMEDVSAYRNFEEKIFEKV